ncbi:hypothetical protein DICPUDRAFT_157031 [Dictyostelium purpureum]|uniref:Uncharacterized protein n=1 Tax=Dictyostelium purpureum TaxID=5786 RepID=F0ZY33_DICPU|nr:uncharacterized protein DICPUDRAFT_157031 [Dictyostelium purpureum]EGC31144.1 hypothetical protein DICPUDRAFT_157031 [Dictyostelium purpureum]|eukprot:XP_003292332.1 hypothetical protein DICPUDRAFT_157031 [Dictyostelium purpureum]
MNQKNNSILLILGTIFIIFNININYVNSTPSTYKPVILMHGFALSNKCGTYQDWNHYLEFIKKYNPGQIAVSLNVDNGFKSAKTMFKQVNDVYQAINDIVQHNNAFDNGFHVIGHSQGALTLRSITEIYGLNIDNFVSLAGVHMGIYGVGFTNNYWFGNFTDKELTNLLYTKTFQKDFSVANWWTDIDHERYLRDNMFLPIINQELEEKIPNYKENFINSISGSFNAFGSPQDGIVVPWISELFGSYDSNLNMVPMEESIVFKNDTFGLQTLANQGKLNLTTVEGVKHAEWLSREDLFVKYVLPLISK